MNDGKIRIVLNRKQAEQLMNLLGMQSEASIKKQCEFIKEGYSDGNAELFNHDYPNVSIEKMNDIAYELFSKLNDCLNPDSITIDLT